MQEAPSVSLLSGKRPSSCPFTLFPRCSILVLLFPLNQSLRTAVRHKCSPIKILYAIIFSPNHAAFPTHVTHLDGITLMCGERQNPRSFLLHKYILFSSLMSRTREPRISNRIVIGASKSKVVSVHVKNSYERVDVLLYSFLTSALYRGLWSALRTGRLTHGERQLINRRKGGWVRPRPVVHSVERRL